MSTLRTNALEGVDAKNSITIVAGAGNITTTNVQEGLSKSWSRTNMSTATNSDSFNVSSISDGGTGRFTININNDMANANYCATDSADNTTSDTNVSNQIEGITSSLYEILHAENGSQVDTTIFSSSVFGDLA